MIRFKFPCLLAVLSYLLIHTAIAEGEIQIQFVSFPKIANAKPVELLIGEGKTIPVELPTNSISPVYKVKPLAKWVIGKTTTDDKGEPTFDIYGQAPSISATKQLILVIREGKDNAGGLKLIPMDYGKSGFSGGQYFMMNATRLEIAGAVGTGKFALKPRKYIMLSPQPTKKKGTRKYCFAKFFYRNKENTQPFFSSTWRFNDKARTMVFFYHDPRTSHLRLHTIRNYVK